MSRTIPVAGSLLFVLSLPFLSLAEAEKRVEGHSYHGEVFNEGPRQAAVLIEGTGQVIFPVTTSSKKAQLFFEQGVGQLHGYWDFEAERSFRQAARLDPDCAMAYWGMALANFKNTKRAKGFVDEAAKRRGKVSPREQLWIDGLAAYFKDPKADEKKRRLDLVKSLERLCEKFPNDAEPKAFLLRQIYQNSRAKIPVSSHYAADLLGKEIFSLNSDHPAHHYVIHLWDRERPGNALRSSEILGAAAPGIAHMWHMPGHIYSRLQRYREAAWQQEASARVDHAHMIKFQLLPDQIHNFAHNNEWLIRNLIFLGRMRDATDLANNMISLPRKPAFKKKDDEGSYNPGGSSWQFGRQRLLDTYFQFEQWEALLDLEKTRGFVPEDKFLNKLDLQKRFAVARFETGDSEGGNRILKEIESQLTAEKSKRDKAVAGAEKKARASRKKEKEIESAKAAARKNFAKKIGDLESVYEELTVYVSLAESPPNLERAAVLLPKLRKVEKTRHAGLWMRAGNHEKAAATAAEGVKAGKNQVLPLAVQVEILYATGKKPEARKAFEQLRTAACEADFDLPALQRLASIAREFGFPRDWRIRKNLPDGSRPRPDLDSLGPFRWSPPRAPDFALPDSQGKKHLLSQRRGKPTLLIFYLGKGCSHCMEQLNKFAPAKEKFARAGIDILAISTDTPEGLAETFATSELAEGSSEENGPGSQSQSAQNSPFPFPLLSDAGLDVFKRYRAFDDFEDQPLHGTFLIDGEQNIRWQDIGFEPFMYSDWLLEECTRLLAIEASP